MTSMLRPACVLACLLLAACTSTENVLQPSALTTTQQSGLLQPAALGSDFRLGFDPVVGASGEATQPLAARLSSLRGRKRHSARRTGRCGDAFDEGLLFGHLGRRRHPP